MTTYDKGLHIHSTITSAGKLTLSLVEAETPAPGADEVVIRMGAAPINPSDLGLLFASADLSTLRELEATEGTGVVADMPPCRHEPGDHRAAY